MNGFNLNVARSFLGKNVNLHLKDGSVIVNVQLAEIQRNKIQNEVFVKCISYGKGNMLQIPLRSIAWAKLVDLNIVEKDETSASSHQWCQTAKL
ncbi:hypothetical protein KEJ37_02535 [Candidatus Bathyarchaeota archaeon]|nr:hypothetical protein [Candidatus Bathyarchaeota archaeon]